MTTALKLIEIADANHASKQMDYEQYECLIELIEEGTINSIGKLSEYIDIADEDTTSRNTELGEPSEGCNCKQLTEIREELTDIKSMIGRLLQREQSEKEDVWTKLRKGTDEFNRITEERKKMNGGDE